MPPSAALRRSSCLTHATITPLNHADMLIIPTCQRSDVDLVRLGEPSDTEKDRLLERVREQAVATPSAWGCKTQETACFRRPIDWWLLSLVYGRGHPRLALP